MWWIITVSPRWDDGQMISYQDSEQPADVKELLENVERHQGPDHFLEGLATLVNELGDTLSFGVTLMVHGKIVTGDVVGGRQYFAGVANAMSTPVSGENEGVSVVRNALTKHLETLRDAYPNFTADAEGDREGSPIKTTYLHLKDAYVMVGDLGRTIPTDNGLWLRLRLSSIDGFCLGSLSV